MELRVVIAGRSYTVDLARPKCLAIPLLFDGPQPNFFAAPAAVARALGTDGFTGDTRRGGSCNVAEIRLVPHCNGTHTESAGHVVHDGRTVHDALPQSLMPALLVSVTPEADGGDRVITRAGLAAALADHTMDGVEALIVRTLPNDAAKKTAVYDDAHAPPYFAMNAMAYLAERGIRHLLVDLPSLDRMRDGGRLANHRLFWNLPRDGHEADAGARLDRTVTEMIFVADDIADGLYLLNLQAPAFASDAAPSRPVIYRLSEPGR